MKTKKLLNLGMMLACGLSIQAQTPIFHEGFDAEQSKQPTDVAYYEYINTIDGDERNLNTTDAFAGAGCLNFLNVEQNGNWWQRAVKFRNLPLQEGKSYRLTFRFKGSNTWMDIDNNNAETKSKMSVALMQGGEDADIPLLDAQGNEFRYELSLFNPDQYEKYTKMFYFASAQLQKDTYAEKNPDKEPLADKWFATFNVYNPGDYYLDEVDLSESPIAAVNFAYEAIRVDFGYATNIKDLVKQNPLGRVIMPEGCASVKLNGADVPVAAVELQSDGFMYIFLDGVSFENPETDKVEIAFKNPADESYQVKYAGTLAPEGAVPDFTDNSGEYLEAVGEATSWAYTEPVLVSTFPENGSFGLAETLDEVSFTFDKPVKATTAYGDPLEAKLNGSEDLVLKTTDESGEGVTTLTFGRQDGKAFTKGSYSITLKGIASAKEIETYKTFTLDFETGKMQIAETIYTDIVTHLLQGAANGQPTGWTIMVGGENWTGGNPKDDNGSACRNMISTGTDGIDYTAFYLCDREGYTYMQYGDKEDARITLPAGNIEFSIMALGHEAAARTLEFRLEDMNGNEIVRYSGTTSVDATKFTTIEAAGAITTKFNNPTEQNVILKIHEPDGGLTAARVLGFKARSYTKTEGESTEAEVILEDKTFGGANGLDAKDNFAPEAGSGWALYQANDDGNGNWKKEPGKDYNYSGTRIFKLGVANLTTGYYTNGNWPNTYAIYGNEEGQGDVTEPMLNLKSGRYQITYYAANWKENGANKGKEHIVHFQLANKANGTLVYEREDNITNCDMNGDRNAAVTAKQVQFTINIPVDDYYTIKVGGTTEQFIGNFKVEKLGSQTAYYLGLIKSARELAIAEYDLCADAKYDGTAKTALKNVIDKYADPTDIVHTPAETNAAKAEIEAATADMATRRDYIARYDDAKQNAANLLAEVGEVEDTEETPGHPATKYAQLDAFKNLEKVYQSCYDKTAQELENAELVSAVQELENNTTLLKNLKDKGIGLLTKQIVDAAAALVKLDDSMSADSYVIAAGNALTDDQEIAKALKLRVTKAIYDKLANNEDLFNILDEDLMENVEDSIDLSGFIQNANFYTTELDASKNLTNAANLPGWTVKTIRGSVGLEWVWVAWNANQYNPINDQFLIAGWNCEWDLSQVITDLPVGKYTYVAGTMDSGFRDTNDEKNAALETRDHWTVTGNKDNVDTEGEIFSYIWWQSGEKRDSVHYNVSNIGQWYGLTDCASKRFDVAAAGEGQTGEATIGSCAISYNASAAVDNFRLYMVGKDDTFDYAAAAQKLNEVITEVVEVAAPEGEPVSVSYYDLSGKKVSRPNGITIKVDTYKNGFMKVSKVLVK